MKVILLITTLIVSQLGFALLPVGDEVIPPPPPEYMYLNTGVAWDTRYSNSKVCQQIHNLSVPCYRFQKEGFESVYGYIPMGCIDGSQVERLKTQSTVVKCARYDYKTMISKLTLLCYKVKKKFLNGDEVCTIPHDRWEETKHCFGLDQQELRLKRCPVGCDAAPKYHVCDWTQEQYNNFKNCTSVKYLTQQTRETICPNGMPDVDSNGPPPRITVLENRILDFRNYLTFPKPASGEALNIEIASLAGQGAPKYCLKEKSDTSPCSLSEYIKFDESWKIDNAKYNLPLKNLDGTSEGKSYKLRVQNSLGKESVMYFDIATSSTPHPPSGSGQWIELLGPDLSPIQPAGDKDSNYYKTTACSTLYQEAKDTTGRRWKCIPASVSTPTSPTGPDAGGSPITPDAGSYPTSPDPSNQPPAPNCQMVSGDTCKFDTNGYLVGAVKFECACGEVQSATPSKYTLGTTVQTTGCMFKAYDMNNIPLELSYHCQQGNSGNHYSYMTNTNNQPSNTGWANYLVEGTTLPAPTNVHLSRYQNVPAIPADTWRAFETNFQSVRKGMWDTYYTWKMYMNGNGGEQQSPGGGDDPYIMNGVYNYTGIDLTGETAQCYLYEKCNSYNVRYDIMICRGGATPPKDSQREWMPFIYPGQYIDYPQQKNLCNPQDSRYIDPTPLNPDGSKATILNGQVTNPNTI